MELLVDRSELWEYKDTSGGMKPLPFLSPLSPDIGSASPPPRTSTEETDPGSEEKQPDTSKGLRRRQTTATRKQEHKSALTIMKQLVKQLELWEDEDTNDAGSEEKQPDPSIESPTLLAAKNGITEMVQSILDKFPVAIWDQDKDEKNIVLLAAEHRRVGVYNIMLKVPLTKNNLFGKVDKEGNSALHLAASLNCTYTQSIPGAVLQMQSESKWYKYVLRSMDQETLAELNSNKQTAQEIYVDSHKDLAKEGHNWLINTSQSCSVVAALVATVAFASASTVPGGLNQDSGFPILGTSPAFHVFAVSSLVALCFSVTSLVMFLGILTSICQISDYEWGLPVKLILGLTTLCMSIASIIVSFCAGDIFVVEGKLKSVAYPIYAIMCFPVIFFALSDFPVFFDLFKQTIKPEAY